MTLFTINENSPVPLAQNSIYNHGHAQIQQLASVINNLSALYTAYVHQSLAVGL